MNYLVENNFSKGNGYIRRFLSRGDVGLILNSNTNIRTLKFESKEEAAEYATRKIANWEYYYTVVPVN